MIIFIFYVNLNQPSLSASATAFVNRATPIVQLQQCQWPRNHHQAIVRCCTNNQQSKSGNNQEKKQRLEKTREVPRYKRS